ncbi:MAG: hypothetical protein KGD63_02465 [Candidatus Lokiarchaeota archaeon]|nr:hypothetical protein [Candidatus Lokiarchaeota archaeon]
MRIKEFAEVLSEKCTYLYEHPYYNRTDLILKEIINNFLECLSKSEWNKLKSKINLKLPLKDMQTVSRKRREKRNKKKKRNENFNELIDMYEAVINNIRNQLGHKEFIKNQQLLDRIKELELEIKNQDDN